MALRVLLADESSTIKKVMQLALQDFGIEVKSVPNGLDALALAQNFKPDIIFVDVLLAKKTGYDVCYEIKNDPSLSITPVVLMWSGFMELDEARTREARPDARLEKPFDTETLREIIQRLVPRTVSNPVSKFLSFPSMPEFVDNPPTAEDPTPTVSLDDESEMVSTPFSESDDGEEFRQVPLSNQDLARFKINLSQDDLNQAQADDSYDVDDDEGQFVLVEDLEALSSSMENTQAPARSQKAPVEEATSAGINMDTDAVTHINSSHQQMIEKVVREQVREVLEAVAWKVIPDIAERIIREEIQKLLKDADQKFQIKL